MKKIILIVFSAVISMHIYAQNPTSYFMEGVTSRSQWNPAFAPYKGYVNVPLVGGIQADINSNVSLSEFVIPVDGKLYSIFNEAVSAATALEGLKEFNQLETDVRLGLLSFGSYTKNEKSFWSFDISTRSLAGIDVPYSLFDFMKNGNNADISNLSIYADNYLEASFCYSLPITEKLYLGARAKLISGIARTKVTFNEFHAIMDKDKWHADVIATMQLSGLELPTKVNGEGKVVYDLENIDGSNVKLGGGYGIGFDFGATYNLLPNLQISASVCDLGFVKWSKSASGVIDEVMEFESVIIEDGNINQPDIEFEDWAIEVLESSSERQSLYASVNIGGEYALLNNKVGLGLFYNMRTGVLHTIHNITASANLKPLKWLHLSGSYSLLNNTSSAVGLGLNICPGFVNLFVATDILLSKKTPQWIPIEQGNMNFSFGLAVPVGKWGKR